MEVPRFNEPLDSASTNILKSVLDHIPILAIFLDRDFNFTWVNHLYAETCGHPLAYFPGKNLFDLYPHEGNQQILREVIDTGEPHAATADPFVFPDQLSRGVTYWDWNLYPIKNNSREVSQLILTLTEVTKRIEAEKALRKSEAKYRRLSENSPAVVYQFLMTPDGKFSFPYMNDRISDIVGLSAIEIIKDAQKLLHMIHPDDHDSFYEKVLTSARTLNPFDATFRCLNNDEVLWIEAHSTPEGFPNGSILWNGFFVDITDRKQTENSLQASHERFLTILDSIDATINVVDMETHEILFMNKRMIESFGRNMTGEICWKAFRDKPGPCPHCTFDKLVNEKGRPKDVYVWHDKHPINKKWYVNYDRVIEWTDGRWVRIQTATDITKLKSLENRLQQAQKMEAIGNLAGGIAHDFNNILFPIIGISEMLLEDFPAGSIPYDNAKEIYKAGIRGSELVKQILAFSRQSEHKMIPVRIQQVLQEVYKLIRPTIPSNIEIFQHIQTNCRFVLADPVQIHQIAMNLITNAFHAMEGKGGEIHVHLKETAVEQNHLSVDMLAPGHYALLSVSDTGCGIDPAIIDKIFNPYFTTKGHGKGTGLGLAVVYGIVKDHNGDIRVDSAVEKGTTFNIYLPLMAESVETLEEKEIGEACSGNERILLVDDEAPIARFEKISLERLGYHVTTRVSSIDALALFAETPNNFDLVITDMAMPNMTGEQLAKELIAIKPTIPIIICTGFSEHINRKKAYRIGIKGFLMKPIVKSELATMIRSVLDDIKK